MQDKSLPNVSFSENLRLAINQMGITQKELGARSGLSHITISRYLSGDRRPGGDELYRMANVLGTSMEWLIGGREVGNNDALLVAENVRLKSKLRALSIALRAAIENIEEEALK